MSGRSNKFRRYRQIVADSQVNGFPIMIAHYPLPRIDKTAEVNVSTSGVSHSANVSPI